MSKKIPKSAKPVFAKGLSYRKCASAKRFVKMKIPPSVIESKNKCENAEMKPSNPKTTKENGKFAYRNPNASNIPKKTPNAGAVNTECVSHVLLIALPFFSCPTRSIKKETRKPKMSAEGR